MTDNDSENTKRTKNDEQLTRSLIERLSKNRMFVDKSTRVIEKNPSTTKNLYPEEGYTLAEITSIVRPHENDQTLSRLNYSKVVIARTIETSLKSEIIYPIFTTISTYGANEIERDTFEISELSSTEIIISIEDDQRMYMVGFHKEDGLPTFNPVDFDPEQPDSFIPASKPLTQQQEMELRSVLDICEITVDNIQS